MAKNENVSTIHRKGKPAGNGRENETLNEAMDETKAEDSIDTEETEVRHRNRHLHKGEELKTFKDTEE